ncbi:hypothetical protein VII00023_18504 [Vibrio ichthyoenteri ATCC 700023]|uniref:Uncharacterized protein n=1 Tax=Vibrio ichthyoenteri ATCC 700023 TaxID=870968 RepID=F9S3N9_9VIBR|nr:hypothetical protein [Vibrio ichthyoenteri]EGU37810.1 hypothetical protein VII00023_18504 [Vibrio ichthyoenteri ATCC 700023]
MIKNDINSQLNYCKNVSPAVSTCSSENSLLERAIISVGTVICIPVAVGLKLADVVNSNKAVSTFLTFGNLIFASAASPLHRNSANYERALSICDSGKEIKCTREMYNIKENGIQSDKTKATNYLNEDIDRHIRTAQNQEEYWHEIKSNLVSTREPVMPRGSCPPHVERATTLDKIQYMLVKECGGRENIKSIDHRNNNEKSILNKVYWVDASAMYRCIKAGVELSTITDNPAINGGNYDGFKYLGDFLDDKKYEDMLDYFCLNKVPKNKVSEEPCSGPF